MSFALAMRTVNKRWPNGELTLHDVDLNLASGEFVALVGPSGCGKSTLLRMAAGLESSTSGTIEVGAKTTEFVFQDPTLLPWRTVAENVALPLDLAGVQDDEQVHAALVEVGLTGSADKLPRELSGGMKMRASVARALVTTPDLFLLDEPFSAVDELRREELNRMLLSLHQRRAFACLLVTHSVTEAVLLADRVVVLSDQPGRVSAVIDIPLPRHERFERRFEEDFVALARLVSLALRGQAA
ncbi:MAG: ABC transporter ATP-binding protein [Ilumatobacteraceae bacterium]